MSVKLTKVMRFPLCWLKLCGGRVESDATGLWFECATCRERSGFVPRAELDRMTDRAIAVRRAALSIYAPVTPASGA